MTDLRDQLADLIQLTDRSGIGHVLWRIRRDAGMSPEGLALRLGMSRSGVCRRESRGFLPAAALVDHAAALVDHAAALGWRIALIPDRPGRRTGTGWPA